MDKSITIKSHDTCPSFSPDNLSRQRRRAAIHVGQEFPEPFRHELVVFAAHQAAAVAQAAALAREHANAGTVRGTLHQAAGVDEAGT